MEDKKNAVIVVDFGQNTFGGYFIFIGREDPVVAMLRLG